MADKYSAGGDNSYSHPQQTEQSHRFKQQCQNLWRQCIRSFWIGSRSYKMSKEIYCDILIILVDYY